MSEKSPKMAIPHIFSSISSYVSHSVSHVFSGIPYVSMVFLPLSYFRSYEFTKLEQQNSIAKIYMYYKLRQACVTNCDSFVLLEIMANVVTNWGSFIITNRGKCCLLQIGTAIAN